MGLRSASKLATKWRTRGAKRSEGRRPPQPRRRQDNVAKAPVVVQHAVLLQATGQPPPTSTFIGKVDRPPQPRRKQDDVAKAPVIVQNAVLQATIKPPPPREFIGKAERPPPPRLGSFRNYVLQSPSLTTREPLRAVVKSVRRSRTTSRRKPQKPKREGLQPEWEGYSTVRDLRSLLSLEGTQDEAASNAVLVSIDCEWERQGLVDYVVEVGITTLRISDIAGVDPGEYLRDWMPRMQHRHIVIDVSRSPKQRMRSSLFGKSMFLSAAEAKTTTLSILRACMANQQIPERPTSARMSSSVVSDNAPSSQLMLVGQSVEGDLRALRGRPLSMNFRSPTATNAEAAATNAEAASYARSSDPSDIQFTREFDTLQFTGDLRRLGVRMPSAKLGAVARTLGVDPAYWDRSHGGSLAGVHNASNDAAYAMMAALLYALKWETLREHRALLPVSEKQHPSEKRKKRLFRFSRPTPGMAVRVGLLGAVAGVALVLQMIM